MLHLLHPIWLIAAAGTIIPVLIHFRNERRGKTLLLGSLKLLRPGPRQTGLSRKLRDLVLLVLRCLILLVIAVILAGPVWKSSKSNEPGKGWVLIDGHNRKETYGNFKPRIDSLLEAGFELHDFRPGFPLADDPSKALTQNTDSGTSLSYWSLLGELDQLISRDVKVWLFTPNTLSRVHGRRPTLDLDLHWETYAAGDTAEWISEAELLPSDNLRITRSRSTDKGIMHATEVIPAVGSPEVESTFGAGRLQVSLKNDTTGIKLTADTGLTRVTVYSDLPGNDASYLQAALEAIRAYSGRDIQTTYVSKVGQIAQHEDWLFWLSAKPVPAALRARNRFFYVTGKPDMHSSVIRTSTGLVTGTAPIPIVRKTGGPSTDKQPPLWTDGFGNPVLAVETKTASVDYLFYSRFDPAWNGLAWSNEFPALLYELLFPDGHAANRIDLRRAPQLLPKFSASDRSADHTVRTEETPLEKPLWILVFALFCMERLVSWSRERRAHG